MSTSQCTETLAETWWLSRELGEENETSPKDWKRISKRKGKDGESTIREFEYKPTGARFLFITDADDDAEDNYTIIHTGDWLYALTDAEADGTYVLEGSQCLSVNPEGYWTKSKALYDQHVMELVHILFGIELEELGGDEVSENQIIVGKDDVAKVIAALDSAGLKRSPEMEAFVKS